jgi:hypothetical protein
MNMLVKLLGSVLSSITDVFNPIYRQVGILSYLPETIEPACTPTLNSRSTPKAKTLRKKRGY